MAEIQAKLQSLSEEYQKLQQGEWWDAVFTASICTSF